jgi:hypothetical protein
MRAVLVVAVAAVVLLAAGCESRNYARVRAVPANGSDDAFSKTSQLTWTGDREVYALVKNPPAIDGMHRARECDVPGPKFPPTLMVGIGEHREVLVNDEARVLASVDDMPYLAAPTDTPPTRMVGVDGPADPRVIEPIGMYPIATSWVEPAPLPRQREVIRMGGVDSIGAVCEPAAK